MSGVWSVGAVHGRILAGSTGLMSSLSQPCARGPRTAGPGARWRNYAAKAVVTGVVLAGGGGRVLQPAGGSAGFG